MDRVLLCALLLLHTSGTAPSRDSSGLGPAGCFGLRETTAGASLAPQRDAAERTPSSGRPFAGSLLGQPPVDRPLSGAHAPRGANYSRDAWEEAFEVAWSLILCSLLLVATLLLCFLLCGRCLLDRIASPLRRSWARNNFILRICNWDSGSNYGAFENTEPQTHDGEGARENAALEHLGVGCGGTPMVTITHRERTDSEVTLEAEDTV